MDLVLVAAVLMALAFAFTNGFHDAASAIATLVATRAARPLPAILMASIANLLGPFLLGGAVANTVTKIVDVSPRSWCRSWAPGSPARCCGPMGDFGLARVQPRCQ